MKDLVIRKFDPRDDYERYLFCKLKGMDNNGTRVYELKGIKNYKAFCSKFKDYDYLEIDVSKQKRLDYFGYEKEDQIWFRNRAKED